MKMLINNSEYLLCKKKNKMIAEYALNDITKPMGVAECMLSDFVPTELAATPSSIGDIEKWVKMRLDINDDDEE